MADIKSEQVEQTHGENIVYSLAKNNLLRFVIPTYAANLGLFAKSDKRLISSLLATTSAETSKLKNTK